MTNALLEALERILQAEDAAAYLDAQDAALDTLAGATDATWHAAIEHSDPNIRWEALQLISAAHADGHLVLERALREDADATVRSCAEALLFRSIVRENVIASGKLSTEALSRYIREVRERAARSFFESRQ